MSSFTSLLLTVWLLAYCGTEVGPHVRVLRSRGLYSRVRYEVSTDLKACGGAWLTTTVPMFRTADGRWSP